MAKRRKRRKTAKRRTSKAGKCKAIKGNPKLMGCWDRSGKFKFKKMVRSRINTR